MTGDVKFAIMFGLWLGLTIGMVLGGLFVDFGPCRTWLGVGV